LHILQYYNYILSISNTYYISIIYIAISIFIYLTYINNSRIDFNYLDKMNIEEAKKILNEIHNNKKLRIVYCVFKNIVIIFRTLMMSLGFITLISLYNDSLLFSKETLINILDIKYWLFLSSLPIVIIFIKSIISEILEIYEKEETK
jgi:hypothetical protein